MLEVAKVLKLTLFPVRSLKTFTLIFSQIFPVTSIFCQYFDNRYYGMHNTNIWGRFWCKRLKAQLSFKETYMTHWVTNSYGFFPPGYCTWSSLPFLKSPCQVELNAWIKASSKWSPSCDSSWTVIVSFKIVPQRDPRGEIHPRSSFELHETSRKKFLT